ncbi:MAG: hypothetical protein ACREV6_06080 [Clostridium sp.]|uniref:hypothetical protein n=1 Tax=Clostridium sp. TaxID=1506 RepID=UPI003D6DA59C
MIVRNFKGFYFYKADAIAYDLISVVSIDRLLFMRVCAMDVQKYKDDLMLIKEYYYSHFTNKEFHSEAEIHAPSYEKNNGMRIHKILIPSMKNCHKPNFSIQ